MRIRHGNLGSAHLAMMPNEAVDTCAPGYSFGGSISNLYDYMPYQKILTRCVLLILATSSSAALVLPLPLAGLLLI